MQEQQITIINKLGLHARAATKLAKLANSYGAQIEVIVGSKTTDGKSIMSLMLLAASKGTDITLRTHGDDEAQAMDALCELINNRFDEPE